MTDFSSNYLVSVIKQFEYYKLLGEKTFAQLSEEELQFQYNAESNSISVIVNHLSGNMQSRWTNFLTEDGEKDWRNREKEFQDIIQTKEQLMLAWNKGWDCLFLALHSVDVDNFDAQVYIRNQGHTITEAVNRQLAHYAYHIGQIVYIGRMIKSSEWMNLSIPKGSSEAYNKKKFAKAKHRAHFTDEFLKPDE